MVPFHMIPLTWLDSLTQTCWGLVIDSSLSVLLLPFGTQFCDFSLWLIWNLHFGWPTQKFTHVFAPLHLPIEVTKKVSIKFPNFPGFPMFGAHHLPAHQYHAGSCQSVLKDLPTGCNVYVHCFPPPGKKVTINRPEPPMREIFKT